MPLRARSAGTRSFAGRARRSLRRVFASEHLARVRAIGDQPIEARLPSAIAIARQEWRGCGTTHRGPKLFRREAAGEPARASALAFGREEARRRQVAALAFVNLQQLFGGTFFRRNLLGSIFGSILGSIRCSATV